MQKIVMQEIIMQKIIELNTEEAKAVAGGALRRDGQGDFSGARFGEGLNSEFNRGGRRAIEQKR
jgi:hypothetical protein